MGHLDLLVITHEHWDHLSGFIQAEEEWSKIRVDALWMAWTEKDDPSGLPGILKKYQEQQRQALALVADRAVGMGVDDRLPTVMSALSFLSDAEAEGLAFGARGTGDAFAARGVGDAFAAAKKRVLDPKNDHVCCEPGEVRRLPGTDAVAYVLGPPRDEARLRRLNPSRRDRETYEEEEEARHGASPGSGTVDPALSFRRLVEGRSAFSAFTMPLLGPALAVAGDDRTDPRTAAELHAEQATYDLSFPFDRSVRIPLAEADRAAADRTADDRPVYPALASYGDEVNHWRRIDFDWLATADAFALQADHLTNNTSLVLAIELPPKNAGDERKVLLFVGDAQVGNWLSWDEIEEWQPQAGITGIPRKANVADLLKRTVFYKVGHHGSHNATLKAKGVERMREGDGLTAFVPVSVPVARQIKDWGKMPQDVMLEALSRRTGGRVVLPDGNIWPPVGEDRIEDEQRRIKLEVSPKTLPPKVRSKDVATIEGEVPLWVQVAIGY